MEIVEKQKKRMGRPSKAKPPVTEVVQREKEEQKMKERPEVLEAPKKKEFDPNELREKPSASIAERISESRKSLDHPLQEGQAFFESPDGEILVGNSDSHRMWSRTMNKGQGGWCNKRR